MHVLVRHIIGMTQIGAEQSAACDVRMTTIRLKVVLTVAKNYELVNKLYPLGEACRY